MTALSVNKPKTIPKPLYPSHKTKASGPFLLYINDEEYIGLLCVFIRIDKRYFFHYLVEKFRIAHQIGFKYGTVPFSQTLCPIPTKTFIQVSIKKMNL